MTDPRHVLMELGIPLAPPGHHHVSAGGEWLGVDCHRCSPGSGRFRMGLKFPTTASCHLCGPIKLWDYLKEITGLGWKELRELFSGCNFAHTPQESPKNGPRRGKLVLPRGKPLPPPHRAYLRERGLSVAECRKRGITGIGAWGGRLAWRVLIPIKLGWEVVSWTTRSINPHEKRRYLSAGQDEEAYPHKRLLYGEELAAHAVAVCEGPLDALALGPGGVATFGVVVSSEQLARIARFPVRVVVADNEPRAVARAEALCRDLEPFDGETHLFVPGGKDLLSSPEREREYVKRRWLS